MILATVLQLAADDPELEGRGPEWGKAAPVALLIILLMGIALFVLIRSMNSQLRKVPSAFMRGEPASDAAAPADPDAPVDPAADPAAAPADATGPPAASAADPGTAPRS